MANLITIDSASYDGRFLRLTCGQEQDVANNRSIIHWTLSSLGGDVNYYSTGPTSVKINGTEVYAKTIVAWDLHAFPAAKGQVSGTITVPHNEDGSKTISVSLSTAIYYTGSSNAKTKTANWELDTINRLAYLTSTSDFTDTQLPTITYVNPKGNDVTALEACISNPGGDVIYVPYRSISKTGTSYTFTAEDVNLLKAVTGKEPLQVKFVIRTRVNGSLYHDSEERVFKVNENDDTKPKVSVSLSPDNPSSFASSVAGLYIQGKTRVKATISAEFKYGAKPVQYSLNVGGITKVAAETLITSDVLSTNGDNVAVTASAKDSRGFTGTAKKSITVYTYSKPLVEPLEGESAVLCYRSDTSGKAYGKGEFVCIDAKVSYSSLGTNNRCTLQWRQKYSTEAWDDSKHDWENLIARTDNTNEYSALVKKDGVAIVFDKTRSYSIQIKAIDDVGEFDIKDFEIPTEDVALHLGGGGKNVSIGEYCDYAEEYTFRSAWKALFDNGIYANHIGSIGLYNNKDFNDLYEVTGYYVGESPPSAVGCLNYPSTNTGMLEVISAMFINETTKKPWGFAYQTYRDYTGAIYTRSYYTTIGWTAWKTIT